MPNLDVDIKVSADVTGAQQTTAALGDVTAAATATATAADASTQSTNALGSSFSTLGTQGRSAITIFKGIEEAGNGTATGMFAAARGVFAFIRVLSVGNPIGLFVTALAAAAGGAVLLGRALFGAGESSEEAKNKFKLAGDEIRKVGQANLKTLETSLKGIGKETDKETLKFKELLQAKEKVDNAEKAALLAENRSNPKLTEEQRTINESKINRTFEERANQQKITTRKFDVTEAETALTSTKQVAQPDETRFIEAVKDFNKLVVGRGNIEGLQREQTELQAKRTAFGTREEDQGVSVREIEILKELEKLKPISDQEIALARQRVADTQKNADTERDAIRIAQERLKTAQDALKLEEDTQKKIAPLRAREEKADLTPKIEKSIETDRTKATANTKEDATRAAEGQKLQTSLATLTAAIDQLKEGILRSQQPTNSADNQARQSSIDALSGQRDKIQSQQDAFNATPSKQDLKRTDTQAAKKDVDSLKLDTKPLNEAEKDKSDKTVKAAQDSQKAIQDTANTINGLPVAKPLNFDPLRNATIEFNGRTIELQKKTQASIEDLAKTVTLQGQQIASLSQQLTAAVS